MTPPVSQHSDHSNGTSPADIALPVSNPTRIRKSKMGRWRGAVLLLVNLLIAAHIVHWLRTGSTMTPLEPSEAMEFSKHNIINAGLIFFALTIFSTLLFGRWFCGWGCHLVALQDLARWILGKLGLRPRPARSGLLAAVPLIAFVYMFIGPLAFRLIHRIEVAEPELHLTTDVFWATFPPWIPAILTFVFCGFAIVYMMGPKAFCNFGCPYGAIFGAVDQLSLWHIRVTDACRGCGHCTAVCSSNVRVHQEVRDFGMVVDPGCMKCLDCVSVCPNDALYFGFGKPPIMVAARAKGVAGAERSSRAQSALRWLVTGLFIFASFCLFMWYDDDFDLPIISGLAFATLIIAALFQGKSRRLAGYSLAEEVLLGLFFLLAVVLFRGLYGAVPFLFCLGLGAIVAYLGVETARLVYKRSLSFHRWRLKDAGRLLGGGYVFSFVMLGVAVFAAHAGTVQYEHTLSPRLAHRFFREGLILANENRFEPAMEMFSRALDWRPDFIEAQENLAGMYCAAGRFEEGIELYEASLRQNPEDPGTHFFLARAYLKLKDIEQARIHLRRATELAPDWPDPQFILNQISATPDVSVEQEVLDQVLSQPIGLHTVAALNLPDAFLTRVVDRIIRSSYHQRYQVVVQDDPTAAMPANDSAGPQPAMPPQKPTFNIQRIDHPAKTLSYRRSLTETRPPLAGFRAPILDESANVWPLREPDQTAPPPVRQAARLVAERLARDGLLPTLARTLDILGPAGFAGTPLSNESLGLLRQIGLPVDLLRFFPATGRSESTPYGVVAHAAELLLAGADVEAVATGLGAIPFEFIESRSDYRVATESGERDIGLLRLQVTRGTYWRGPGAGGSVDVARQLIEALPEASFLISLQDKHLEGFSAIAGDWQLPDPRRLTILPQPLIVSQWAQDNGKSGVVGSRQDHMLRSATLVPRFASRREDGSVFVPGESFLADGLAATGHLVVQSPLLFQGGNLLAVRNPLTGERLLLIGEAEVYRNTALGLSPAQVLAAFAREFAVDRCEVLPAVSFHVDFDLTIRAHGDKMIAFVNDSDQAVRIILELGIDALEAHGTLGSTDATLAKSHLQAGRAGEFFDLVSPVLNGQAGADGSYGLSFARLFSSGPVDSPVGNLQRFLVALDLLASRTFEPEQLANRRHFLAYMRSMQRRRNDREALHQQLRDLGFYVHPVPSLAEADRSINYLNGLHEKQRYLMPVYGGFYATLDRAAASVFEQALTGVTVVPILCGESQRRVGAIHCSVAAYPRTVE